ncbi:MAG TPA: hypothetical protein DDZ80_30750, partial [Cyanobacteria bacterium UBA8803]|nr:hypothetical protein [Cyanobacteria bacterium UBA8803]
KQPTTNNQQQTTNNQQPTTNNQQPTTNNKQQTTNNLLKLAAKVLKDPLLMRKLSDRVYHLMQEDLRNQRERTRNSRGFF